MNIICCLVPNGPTLCHLDRSAAQWRDLRFVFPKLLLWFLTGLPFVISTGAQRSGGDLRFVFPKLLLWFLTSLPFVICGFVFPNLLL